MGGGASVPKYEPSKSTLHDFLVREIFDGRENEAMKWATKLEKKVRDRPPKTFSKNDARCARGPAVTRLLR